MPRELRGAWRVIATSLDDNKEVALGEIVVLFNHNTIAFLENFESYPGDNAWHHRMSDWQGGPGVLSALEHLPGGRFESCWGGDIEIPASEEPICFQSPRSSGNRGLLHGDRMAQCA